MGSSKRKREAFLALHPMCCFCGGSEVATTEDHIPSRAMFRDRVWPEGYSFPACVRCQGATSKEEMLTSLISRMSPGPKGDHPKELAYFEVLLQSAENNFPGILASFNRVSANEKRKVAKRTHIELPQGSPASELPIIALKDPRVEAAVVNFARKLLLALYYRHTGRIIPQEGGGRFRWWTNANDLNVLTSPELRSLLQHFPKLRRARTDLADQFSYQFASPVDNPNLYAFLATFNNSFVLLGMVSERLDDVAFSENVKTVVPYTH